MILLIKFSMQVKLARKVTSDLLMETTFMKAEWNFATTISGELSAMMLLAGLIVP